MTDQAGVEALLRTENGQAVTAVGKGWQRFLADAKDHREAAAAGETDKAAGIYAAMESRYGSLMNLLPEVNGTRIALKADNVDGFTLHDLVTNGKPIETMDELTSYLTSTNGLLRLNNGMAAREAVVMPGRLSWFAERKAAADTRKAKSTTKWIDYAKPQQLIPNEAEQRLLDEATDAEAVRAGLAQNNLMLKTSLLSARAAKAKVERVARRFTSQIPNVTRLDLTDPGSARIVEQVARTYLNKGDAAKLASSYVLAPDLAAKRAVVRGVLLQSFHASGLSRSEGGRAFMERYIGDQSILDKQQYGYGDTSKILTDRGEVQVALYPDQVSKTVVIPSFREMNYNAAKFAVGGFIGRKGMGHMRALTQSDGMDALMGTIKLGWIASAAGGLRNALDEVANFAAYGMGKDVLAARVAFTKATKDLRAQRRAASVERRALISTLGRTAADDRIGDRLGQGLKSYEDTALAVERGEATTADLKAAQAELHQAQLLQTAIAHRIPYAFRRAADSVNDVFVGAALGKAMSVFGKDWAITGDRVKWAQELVDREAGITFRDGIFQANHADTQLVDASDHQAMDYHHAGAMARKYGFRPNGWGRVEIDGGAGITAHAKALQLRFADTASPAHSWVQTVNALIRRPSTEKHWVEGEREVLSPERIEPGLPKQIDHDAVKVGDKLLVQAGPDGKLTPLKQVERGAKHEARTVAKVEKSERPAGKGKTNVWTYTLDDGATVEFTRASSKKTGGWPYVAGDDVKVPAELGDAKMPEFVPMTREEWADALDAARESVLRRVDDEDMRHFVGSAEMFQWYKGTKIAKGDEETLALAKAEYADRVSADLAQVLSARGGGLSRPLLDELAAGRVPDRSWLAQLPEDQLPDHAIGQLWAPYNPAAAPGQINRGYTGMLTKVYDKAVTDQINALSRNPLVTALYMRARQNTQGYVDHLIGQGFDEHVADDIARRMAAQQAEVEALKHIDNPYVSSQFSMLSRNMFAFVRAQEDWLKRWGRTIKDNPELIRKAQLAIHGGESVGFLEQDDQGELHFVYPASGLLLGVLGGFFGVMNQPNGARIPMQKELSSQLTFLNPSLDNPLGFSGTPLVSLPWKAIAHFMGPDHALMNASIDKVINGELGAGREWWEQMLPSWANRIIGGVLPTEDMGSKYGAAIQSTLANMEAAGMLADPQYQTPEGQARLLHALQVGTHNDLLATALFGFFAPAAPTYEGGAAQTADGYQGTEADWSAHIEGLRSLKDEARQVFARMPYEDAKAWWTATHPNESILAPTGAGSRTSVGADNASAPATVGAASYLEKHTGFFDQYGGKGGVAAYFIPQGPAGTTNGSYSDVAYRAQLELGIRDYKSLSEYFSDVVTARGYAQYFAAKDAYDAKKIQAGGSASLNNQVDAEWQQTRAGIMAGSPLLAQRLAANAVDNAATGATIQSLYHLVDDRSPSTTAALGANRDGVAAMLAVKEQFDQGTAALGDRRGSAANRRRNELKTSYDAQINQLATQYPGLADLARGVFRPTS
jgi:hypothetical protein